MPQLATWAAAASAAISVGRIAAVTSDGTLLVDYPENPTRGPVTARFVSVGALAIGASLIDRQVLIVFEEADLSRPIVLGPVFDRVPETMRNSTPATTLVEAKDEVVLKCGESSLSMKKDGKVVLKGTTIVSRASRANKIKGGTVAIN